MPIILEMPSLSPSMTQGNLVSWLKKEGDEIFVGDVIAEIDTDKATMEVESIYNGILEKIVVPAGTHDVLIKTPIAVIRQKNDTDQEVADAINSLGKVDKEQQAIKIEPKAVEQFAPKEHTNAKVSASPLAKRIACELGIDLAKIIGTGPGKRIVKADVLSHTSASSLSERPRQTEVSAEEYIDEDITTMRRVIAERLTKSKQETPHAYMTATANVSELINIRKEINGSGLLGAKILIDAFVAKATALAMQSFPEVNAIWVDDKIRRYKNIDVSIAVAIDGGVITPIVRDCNQKSLKDISNEIAELANRAKSGKLTTNQFVGGGITISNLGMFGIDSFYSIINPPQSSILSIGPAKKTPVCNDSGEVVVASIMSIGYAIDHRVLDGAVAAKFLCNMIKYLENPTVLMAC